MNGNWRREDKEDQQPMFWKHNKHQTMRNLGITTGDAQDRNQWRTIINGKRNCIFFTGENLCIEKNSI